MYDKRPHSFRKDLFISFDILHQLTVRGEMMRKATDLQTLLREADEKDAEIKSLR